MSFIRRFTEFPPDNVLTAIEGVNIIDLPPPGSIEGLGTGFACVIGEFADCTYAVEVDPSTGAISEDIRPQQVISGQDLINRGGGFDATLGQFGGDCGNGFAEVRNRRYSSLAIVPINLASSAGVRFWRDLPTNASVTNPTPVVPVSGAIVEAGREFRNGAGRLKGAGRVTFADTVAFVTGVDGSLTTAGAATTQTMTSAGSTFVDDGVSVGDILVLGVVGGAGAVGANAGTFRIQAVTDNNTLVYENLDGSTFATTLDAATVFRIHPANVADSGAGTLATQNQYTVPARPLTDSAGVTGADGTWPVSTALTPAVVPPAVTATSASPLSGLAGAVGPTLAVAYTDAVQAENAENSAELAVLYSNALNALLDEAAPAREINIVWAARKMDTIRTALRTHAADASAIGIGRTVIVSPELDIAKSTALETVTGDTAPGVGATRSERVFYSWPPARTFITEAVGSSIQTADGRTTTDGDIDVTYDSYLASLLSNLAPERNPGEASRTALAVQSTVLGLGRNVPRLNLQAYELMRQRGIAGLRIDRRVGAVIQSGVTSSLVAGQKNINRRRMADFIEDSIAENLVTLAKLPLSDDLEVTIVGSIDEFLAGLLSVNNPPAQRISDYLLDSVSGNTPSLKAKGVFVVIVKVRLTPTADFITVQFEIGEGVVTATTL